MYIYLHMYIYIYIHAYVYVYVYVCIYISMYACMYIYMYMCICIYMCIYTSPYAFLKRVCMHSQVLLSTMHVQVCTLDRCWEYQRTHLLHARYREMCICAMYTHVYMHMYMYIYMCMHVYIYIYVCIFMRIYAYVYGCVYVCVCMYMYIYVCICMCLYICICLYTACMCSLFHLTLGNEDGGVQLVYESACCLAWGVFFDRRKDRDVVCVFSIFNVGGSVCGCVCVYTHTHTHTTQHLEGPKNPDGLNLGIHIFVYVYKVHMCTYILRGGMRSWTNCFFF